MKEYIFSDDFKKTISKLKGIEREVVKKKIQEILSCSDISHYKNLKYKKKPLKRVHINTHFVMLFYEEGDVVYFIDYLHHDNAYKR